MPAEPPTRRAVFLDRDGTLMFDTGFPREPDEVALIPGAVDALASFRDAGFLLVLISNQSGIGRGIIAPDQAVAVHERFVALLREAGLVLDASYYCPHPPEEKCVCRKPSPELLRRAARDLNISLGESFMIGDRLSDVEAGTGAGCTAVLFDPGGSKAAAEAHFVAAGWPQAVQFVLSKTAPIP